MNIRGLSLTSKIFLATAAIVAAVLGATLVLTGISANRAAERAVNKALATTQEQVRTQLAERAKTLQGNAQTFVGASTFFSLIQTAIKTKQYGDVLDQAMEGADRTGAKWVQITDADGVRIAKSDEPLAPQDSLGGSALIGKVLQDGLPISGYGNPTDTSLIQAVSVPIIGPGGTPIGVLMAVLPVDSTFATNVRNASGGETDIAVYALDQAGKPHLAGSSLGRSDALTTLIGKLSATAADSTNKLTAEENVGGRHYVASASALLAASGRPVGGVVVLRDRDREFAAFNRLRLILLFSGGVGLLIAGLLSFGIARQITRPVGELVVATRRAAQGDYSADIEVTATGEIGTLADAFRAMLNDLRDKQALVEFLGGNTPGEARTVRMSQVISAIGETAVMQLQEGGITPGSRFAQRYEVKEVLGVGGMGMVFKAVDSELGELIAIKTLKQDILTSDTSALERFKSEIRLARKISHRNVVRTHDLGEFSGVYYITMEYVEGKSLKELVRSRGRLPIPVALGVAKQLCRALEVAHEQGVIHRDIKPQNMVVEPDGTLKVMDFGIARLANRQTGVTQAGMVVGTPEYMAPEQLMGDDIDARADIYAAGCVIYECLTGSPPITADNQISLIAKLLEETPIPPRVVNPEVSQPLSDLVMRVLSKKAADRPQTATELHDLIAAIG